MNSNNYGCPLFCTERLMFRELRFSQLMRQKTWTAQNIYTHPPCQYRRFRIPSHYFVWKKPKGNKKESMIRLTQD